MRFSLVMSVIMVGMGGLLLGQITDAKQNQTDPCMNAKTQLEMNECYSQQAKKADAELNVVYKKLMSALDQNSQAKLKSAEIAWIKYRDANCAFVAGLNEGGSVYLTAVSVCIADMTHKRINELKNVLIESR